MFNLDEINFFAEHNVKKKKKKKKCGAISTLAKRLQPSNLRLIETDSSFRFFFCFFYEFLIGLFVVKCRMAVGSSYRPRWNIPGNHRTRLGRHCKVTVEDLSPVLRGIAHI